MIGRAVLTAVKDGESIQQVQVKALSGESLDKIQHFQNFGFTSNPPTGTEGIILCLGGNRENMVVVATDNRDFRLKDLAPGESAMYNKNGKYVKLTAANNMEILLSKFKINNGTKEYVAVEVSLVQAIIDARVMTAMGPQPLLNVSPTFPAIKADYETFKI